MGIDYEAKYRNLAKAVAEALEVCRQSEAGEGVEDWCRAQAQRSGKRLHLTDWYLGQMQWVANLLRLAISDGDTGQPAPGGAE